jgi:hypothetical protein
MDRLEALLVRLLKNAGGDVDGSSSSDGGGGGLGGGKRSGSPSPWPVRERRVGLLM